MREIIAVTLIRSSWPKKFRSEQMGSDADPHSFPRRSDHLPVPPSNTFQRERWPSGHAMLSPRRRKGGKKVPKYQFLMQKGHLLKANEHIG